jgi:hypothetical protein
MPTIFSHLRDGDLQWLKRALDRSIHGIDGPY